MNLSKGVRYVQMLLYDLMKHTYDNARSQQYAGDPDLYMMHLFVCLMCLYFLSTCFFVAVDVVHYSSYQ